MSVIKIYRIGRGRHGWLCRTCERQYDHHGKPLMTYLAFLDHLILIHHRVPRLPKFTVTVSSVRAYKIPE